MAFGGQVTQVPWFPDEISHRLPLARPRELLQADLGFDLTRKKTWDIMVLHGDAMVQMSNLIGCWGV